jgi:hypothetical protein
MRKGNQPHYGKRLFIEGKLKESIEAFTKAKTEVKQEV